MNQAGEKRAFVVRETSRSTSAVRYSVRVGTGLEDADLVKIDKYYYPTESEAQEAASVINLLMAGAVSDAMVKLAGVMDRKHRAEIQKLSNEITTRLKETQA